MWGHVRIGVVIALLVARVQELRRKISHVTQQVAVDAFGKDLVRFYSVDKKGFAMKSLINISIAVILLTIGIFNLAFGPQAGTARAQTENPCASAGDAPGPSCTCCTLCGCWMCNS